MTQPGEHPGDDDQLRHIEEIINTLGGELTGGQEDLDRVMPEAFLSSGDEERIASLRNADYEGVPLPYVFQFVVACGGWVESLQNEGSSPELISEIKTGLGIRESRYPEAPGWDRSRTLLARELLAADDLESAIDLMAGMRSKHELARTVISFTADAREREDEDPERILTGVMDRFLEDPEPTNYIEFLQAIYDEAVKDDAESPILDGFELLLSDIDPDYDPVRSWAESMAKDVPEVNWDGAANVILNEEMWPAGTSLRFRQNAMASHFELRVLMDAAGLVDEKDVEDLLIGVAAKEAATEAAPIWDQLRFAYGSFCLDAGQPSYALEFGRAMRDPSSQQQLITRMILYGQEDTAMLLAEDMVDGRLMAETFLDGDWLKNDGSLRLATIIEDESYPIARRIDCISVVRDRMVQSGHGEGAALYDPLLAELRQRLVEEQN